MADNATPDERIYTIPLRHVKSSPRNHQTDRAIRHIKAYLKQHMKSDDIWIDAGVNELIWAHGMYTVPSRIRVRARRFDDGVVEVSLPEAEHKASIREEIKKRKEKADEKKKAHKKDEAKDEKSEPKAASKKPSARPLIDIEGVGPTYAEKLQAAGYKVMDDLVKPSAAEIAQKTGLSVDLVGAWKAMADLDRLDSINNQYAELLARSGVASVDVLAKAHPAAIVTQIEAYLTTVKRPPTTQAVTEAMASEWIREARKFVAEPAAKPKAEKPAPKAADKAPAKKA